jgi:hypothetical protein
MMNLSGNETDPYAVQPTKMQLVDNNAQAPFGPILGVWRPPIFALVTTYAAADNESTG